jgi:anti-sigma factor RsiW
MSDVTKDHRLEDIMLYEGGAFTEAERAEFEEHLRGCPACQATLEEVRRFLPQLDRALEPDEPSPEELVAWARAQMRAKELAKAAQPAGFFTRVRVALIGFGLAAASTVFIVVQTLLRPMGPVVIAHAGEDGGAQAHGGLVAAPRRPQPKSEGDAGVEGGIGAPAPVPAKEGGENK